MRFPVLSASSPQSIGLQSFKFCQLEDARVEAPKCIATERQCRSDMQTVVCAKAMLSRASKDHLPASVDNGQKRVHHFLDNYAFAQIRFELRMSCRNGLG